LLQSVVVKGLRLEVIEERLPLLAKERGMGGVKGDYG
jgi:hypothetical protein